MRVLITGHLGYIGTVLVPMLLKRGHDVTGMDADWYARCTFGEGIVPVPNVRKDIRDTTVADFRGYDTVLHLAALSNDPLGNYNPDLTDEINHIAAIRVGKLAREAGVRRFVFSSTCANYGAAGDSFNDETASFNPCTPYARSKVAAELGLTPLSDDRFTVTILRSATAYGWSPRIRFDLVINNLTAHALTTGRILMKSDGTPWRAVVHIEDIARAFVAAAEAPRELVKGEAFNVGRTSENYRIRDLAQLVAQVVPDCRIEYAPNAGPDPRCYRVNCDKLPRVLEAFQPAWSAKLGVEQVGQMIRKVGLEADEFEGSRYARLPHLKKLITEGSMDDRFRWRDSMVKVA